MKTLESKKYYALKMMKKTKIVKLDQLEHIQNEIHILSRVRCPFVCELKAVFQDENSVYEMFEYIPGGELFSHLRKHQKFEFPIYQFFAVEVACALDTLHRYNIVYRDLKPENIVLNKNGHIRLNEFCLAKVVTNRTFTLCGTPEYLSPELIQGNGYAASTDWWAFGVLVYEMAMGYPPFFGKNPFWIYRKILECRVSYSESMAFKTKRLISSLLVLERKHRLGCDSGGFNSVKHHNFFKGVDWVSGMNELILSPLIPTVAMEGDTSNYDYYPEETIEEPNNLNSEERKMFEAINTILDRK